jgi:hypothetical protein
MKTKGRRQSDNVIDIRDPKAKALFEAKTELRLQTPIGREIRDNYMREEVVRIQNQFGHTNDVEGMEILLGPRWKD